MRADATAGPWKIFAMRVKAAADGISTFLLGRKVGRFATRGLSVLKLKLGQATFVCDKTSR